MIPSKSSKLQTVQVKIKDLKPALYNPRKWSEGATEQLTESIKRFGLVDPIIVNNALGRENIVIGGHFRLYIAKKLDYKEVPVIYLDIVEEAKEKELNLRLNKNLGEWDYGLLAELDEPMLADVGFSSEELDDIFDLDVDSPSEFSLEKELEKLDITSIKAKKGDIYQLGDSRLMIGDSTINKDMSKLMGDEKADMLLTDPPYILDYQHGKRHGKPAKEVGLKKNRQYLETDEVPDDFTELWMNNIAQFAKPDFSAIVYESWKNLPVIWAEMKKHWVVKNMIVWHIPGRNQGFAAANKFFSKFDIAVVGGNGTIEYNLEEEADGLQEEYETALYAISGKPYWQGYETGQKDMPTDFIEFDTDDKKNSGQSIIFGTKPLEILIPYIKVLTKRGDLIVEPFCGSGSTLIAATKLKRRCFIMEKSPVYAEVALRRWEQETGKKRKLMP